MKSFYTVCLFLPLISCAVHAVEWHDIQYHIPQDSHVTSLTGTIVIPSLPCAGVCYIWPGLQQPGHPGVYQDVLDGSSGKWWMAAGWVGDPPLPWGNGHLFDSGESVQFSNVQGGDGGALWTTTLTNTKPSTFELRETAPAGMEDTLHLLNLYEAGKNFDLVLFAIELYNGTTWDFGPLSFKDITIVRSSLPEYLQSLFAYILPHRQPPAQTPAGAMTTLLTPTFPSSMLPA